MAAKHTDPKTSAEVFKYLLYKDPEFLVFAQQFSSWLTATLDEASVIVLGLTTRKDNPLKAELQQRLGECEGAEIIEKTAREFEVPEHVVEYGFMKSPEHRGVSGDRRPIVLSPEGKTVTVAENALAIMLFPNTRLEDIEDIWPIVESLQKEVAGYVPQLQTTANYELIYAIYKQRLRRSKAGRHTTFPEIFRMYQDGILPGYSGSTTQYGSAHSLAAKYRQYKPKANEL